jgi:predicted nucleic acid-binding Zn ribbon protein
MICPVCRRGYPPDARFCPTDAEELVPYAMFVASQRNRPPEGSPTTKICPDCGHRYDVDVRFCGKDGRELVLVN